MIDHEALLDRLLVVVGTTTLLSTEQETLHQLILGHVELDHRSHLVTTLTEHLLQSLSLWDGTGETIEDHTLVLSTERVIDRCKDRHHQIVGDQLTIVDITLGGLTQFGTVLNLITEHITRGDVVQTVLLYQFVALRSLAGTWRTKNHNILHLLYLRFTDLRFYSATMV